MKSILVSLILLVLSITCQAGSRWSDDAQGYISDTQTIFFAPDKDCVDGVNLNTSEFKTVRAIFVESFCDEDGSDEYNMDLSIKRAEFVVLLLMASGIPCDKIFIKPYGHEFCSRHKNFYDRRVDVYAQF